MKSLLKKGQVETIGPAIIALTIAGVFLILGLVMLQELTQSAILEASEAGNGTAFIQSNLTLAGLASFADFWEIIVLAIVISVVIGLLLVVFGGRGRR